MTGLQPCFSVLSGGSADGTWPVASTVVGRILSALYKARGSTELAEVRGADAPAMIRDGHTDARDIAGTLQGDGHAYRRLVERYQNEVAALMSRFTRDPRQLEELVQDVFVEAWRSLPSFDAARRFYPWLRTVAVHVGYRYWKSLKRAEETVSLDEIGEVAAAPDATSPERAEEVLHGLLARLPPRDRLVLTLIYLDGRSVAETAELTGWSKIMVKVQAHRARAKLKRLVRKGLAERAAP